MLKRCLADYSEMADVVVMAENNINILQFILDIANVSDIEKNTYLEQFIKDEISKPNDVELSVYNEIEYNELIISCNGDMELTQQIYEEREEKRKKNLNLIGEMIDWIYKDNKEKINGQIVKNMFTLTKMLQRKAIDQYVQNYRKCIKHHHKAVLGEYETEIDFNNRSMESQKISSYYEAERDHQLSQIKYVLTIVGAIITIVGIGMTIGFQTLPCLLFSVVGVALMIYNILSNQTQKKHIMQTCSLNIQSKNKLMDQLFQEYTMYVYTLAENDAYYDKILVALEQF